LNKIQNFREGPVSNKINISLAFKTNRNLKRITEKRIFIELTQEFYRFRLIQPKVKLMLHSNYIDIEDLTTFNISDGFILYEKIVSK
jgi:hypothetical protein